MTIPGYDDPEKAQKLIQDAADLVKTYTEQGIPVPTSPQATAKVESGSSAKQRAEEQLKAELSKLGQE
jgi:N utilization substance protein A